MATDLYQRAELKEDLFQMINDNTDLAGLFINILDHALRKAGVNNNYTDSPEKIKISNISMDNSGNCSIRLEY